MDGRFSGNDIQELGKWIEVVAAETGDDASLYKRWFTEPPKSKISDLCQLVLQHEPMELTRRELCDWWMLVGGVDSSTLVHHLMVSKRSRYGSNVRRFREDDGTVRYEAHFTTRYPPYVASPDGQTFQLNPLVATALHRMYRARRAEFERVLNPFTGYLGIYDE